MKRTFLSFQLFCLLTSFNVNAEVSRKPAVVEELCDLDIPTMQIKLKSEKVFTSTITHKLIVRSDNDLDCKAQPKKRYADSVYEENASNEIKILFQKYKDKYSLGCKNHFKQLRLKDFEFVCDAPEIISITLKDFGCEKISFAASAFAEIKYKQSGWQLEEKSAEMVQKEQCARVKECIGSANDKDLPELEKLSAVACKSELSPVSPARSPTMPDDTSFNGSRKTDLDPKNRSIGSEKPDPTNIKKK